MIKFRCACGQKIGVPETFAGKRVKCPGCGKPALAPADATATAVEPTTPQPPQAAAPKAPRPAPAAPPKAPPAAAPAAARKQPESEPLVDDSELTKLNPLDEALATASAKEPAEGSYDLALEPQVAPVRAAPAAPKPVAAKAVPPPRGVTANTRSSDPTDIGEGSPVRALIGATIAAAIGAAVWGGIGAATGYEVGYVAWGIGVIVDLGAAIAANGKGIGVALVAAVMAIAGIGVGKVLVVNWSSLSKKDVREFVKDDDAMHDLVAVDMISKKQFSPEITKAIAEEKPLTDAQKDEVTSKSKARLQGMSQQEKEAIAAESLGKVISQMPFHVKLLATLGPLDALWALLAVLSAFRLGYSGGGGSDDS